MSAQYATETTRVSAEEINANFLNKLQAGRIKEAAAETTTFIRAEMREESFSRKIITPQLLTAEDLDPSEHTDLPRKLVPIEPDSAATFVPFRGTARRRWFKGKRFPVYIGMIESERFMKNKFELMTYDEDIVQIISDNSVKDMAAQEDSKFMTTCRAITTAFPGQVVTATGGLNAANVVSGLQNMVERKVPIGMMLMTESMYLEALKLPATSIGDIAASRQYDEGLGGKSLWGIPVITTIKNDLVNDNEIWIFAPENYLGKFYLLQDATLFIKQEGPMIEFYSYSALGIGFGATLGVTLINF